MSIENFPEPWQKKLADLATAYGVEIESLTVTENGTYSEEGKAYSPVIVNVSGGGGNSTNDIYIWNISQSPNNEVIPTGAKYWSGIVAEEDYMVYSNLVIENITCTYSDTTIYGVKIKDAPSGCNIILDFDDALTLESLSIGYSLSSDFNGEQMTFVDFYQIANDVSAFVNLKPITYEGTENFYTIGVYTVGNII